MHDIGLDFGVVALDVIVQAQRDVFDFGVIDIAIGIQIIVAQHAFQFRRKQVANRAIIALNFAIGGRALQLLLAGQIFALKCDFIALVGGEQVENIAVDARAIAAGRGVARRRARNANLQAGHAFRAIRQTTDEGFLVADSRRVLQFAQTVENADAVIKLVIQQTAQLNARIAHIAIAAIERVALREQQSALDGLQRTGLKPNFRSRWEFCIGRCR